MANIDDTDHCNSNDVDDNYKSNMKVPWIQVRVLHQKTKIPTLQLLPGTLWFEYTPLRNRIRTIA